MANPTRGTNDDRPSLSSFQPLFVHHPKVMFLIGLALAVACIAWIHLQLSTFPNISTTLEALHGGIILFMIACRLTIGPSVAIILGYLSYSTMDISVVVMSRIKEGINPADVVLRMLVRTLENVSDHKTVAAPAAAAVVANHGPPLASMVDGNPLLVTK